MFSHLIKVMLLIFLVTSTNSQVQYITFNVNPVSLTRANFFLNILTNQIQTYNWIYCNKVQLYNTISNTLVWLRQVRNGLPYGNIVSGSGNQIAGQNNIVIGNKNIVAGVNNWVFVSNYRGKSQVEDSILAIGNYQINLKKLNDILINPTLAISTINGTVY